MSKVKTGKYSNFRERNRKSQGYLLKKLLMDYTCILPLSVIVWNVLSDFTTDSE